MKFEHQKTQEILNTFESISKIPRCSKHEEKICQWMLNWAKTNNFEAKTDKVGNVLIKVPPTQNYKNSPTLVIQGHLDMVCEKTPESTHDFSKDPIQFVFDGEWLKANKTSLGSDNGIGLALGMVLAIDPAIDHPALELLFTIDEETGLTGANALEPGFIQGRVLLNVDSEDEGYFTVGCAGGINTNLTLPLKYQPTPQKYKIIKIIAGGMKGGHSGIDINKEKANAIKVLARVLTDLRKASKYHITDFQAGTAHNAIPRNAEVEIVIPEDKLPKVKKAIANSEVNLKNEYQVVEPDLYVTVKDSETNKPIEVLTSSSTKKMVDFLTVLPHGVDCMSTDIQNLVETSNNLAKVKIEDKTLKIITSQRSSKISRLKALTNRIEAVARLAGGKGISGDGYPPWQPNMDSPLLKKCAEVYEQIFQKKPVVEIIHAGLECGIIGDKYEGMDMISLGPTLRFPHSPDEKVNIPSIAKVWDFLVALLKSYR